MSDSEDSATEAECRAERNDQTLIELQQQLAEELQDLDPSLQQEALDRFGPTEAELI